MKRSGRPKRSEFARRPRSTLDELRTALGTSLSRSTLCRALRQLKLSLKISPDRRRTDAARRRAAWRLKQFGFDPERLLFLDETWVKTNMTRPSGRAPLGARLNYHTAHCHWKTTTFLAALRTRGLTALLVVDGATNGELFRGYVEQHLAPTLSAADVVVMDNLNSHKVAGVRAAIEAAGAELLFLPPFGPDFNLIERVFAKFKWLIRSAAERTIAGLWRRCGELVSRFDEAECHNYFRHSGYRYTYLQCVLVVTVDGSKAAADVTAEFSDEKAATAAVLKHRAKLAEYTQWPCAWL